MTNSLINLLDSYKYSHSSQYPKNMISMYDYMESRGGTYPSTVFVGLSYYIQKYLLTPITVGEVIIARTKAEAHGIPFDYDSWMYIAVEHDGLMPVEIKAVPEGSLVPTGHPLLTIESTDSQVPWVAGALETLLMKLWYPTNIATKSYYVKQMLQQYGSPEWSQFAYHCFGDRGSSSVEAAAIGGFAHLTQFMGTDNFNSLDLCAQHYNEPMAGYSVFAAEHSTTTSHGKINEEQFVYDMLLANPDAPIMSFVADSYDVYDFTEFCTTPGSRIRELVESRPHQKFVLRPDSGEPIEVLDEMLHIMNVNSIDTIVTPNGSHKILFKDFGILWGDGITPQTIEEILEEFTAENDKHYAYAAENFVFGSGGDLMQNHTRDTQRFAIKCSSITTLENKYSDNKLLATFKVDRDVYKDPITDPGKTSKKGKVTTYYNPTTSTYFVDKVGQDFDSGAYEVLQTVYKDGLQVETPTLAEIRNQSAISLTL